MLQKAVRACELFVLEGIETAMNQINGSEKNEDGSTQKAIVQG